MNRIISAALTALFFVAPVQAAGPRSTHASTFRSR